MKKTNKKKKTEILISEPKACYVGFIASIIFSIPATILLIILLKRLSIIGSETNININSLYFGIIFITSIFVSFCSSATAIIFSKIYKNK